jgi:hypothetical protein
MPVRNLKSHHDDNIMRLWNMEIELDMDIGKISYLAVGHETPLLEIRIDLLTKYFTI